MARKTTEPATTGATEHHRQCNRCNALRAGDVTFCPECSSPEFTVLDGPLPTPDADPAQEPESSPPAEAPAWTPDPAILAKLAEANAECDEREAAWLESKEQAASDKKAFEAALERVRSLSRQLKPETLPLFDRPAVAEAAADAPDADENEPADDRLATRLDTLGLKPGVLKALAEAKVNGRGIATVGDLAAYTATDAPLTMIRGIGEAAQESILEALDAFWAANPDAEAVVAAATAAIDEEAA